MREDEAFVLRYLTEDVLREAIKATHYRVLLSQQVMLEQADILCVNTFLTVSSSLVQKVLQVQALVALKFEEEGGISLHFHRVGQNEAVKDDKPRTRDSVQGLIVDHVIWPVDTFHHCELATSLAQEENVMVG